MKVIDFRTRPPYKSFLKTRLFPKKQVWPDAPTTGPENINHGNLQSAEQMSFDLFLGEMEDAGISLGIVHGRQSQEYGIVSNDEIAELVQAYPDKFLGFAGISLEDPKKAIAEIRRTVKEYGFKGVALEPGWEVPSRFPDDERHNEVYDVINELGVVCSITSSIYLGPDMEYCHPKYIQRVAMKYPNMNIAIAHACWPYIQEVLGLAHMCSNVYLVPDFYGYIPNTPMADQLVRAANFYLKYRMIYASSYPVRALEQSVQDMGKLGFRADVYEQVMYENAKRLLKL